MSRIIPPAHQRLSVSHVLGSLAMISVAAIAANPAAAEPRRAPVLSSPIALVLDRADVFVTVSESTDQGQIEAAFSDDATRGEGIELAVSGGQIRLSRDPGLEDRRIRIDLVLRADQELGLEGEDLAVEIEGSEDLGLSGDGALIALAVQDSRVQATRVADLAIGAVDSRIDIAACQGVVMLEVTRSSLTVAGHFGELEITAIDSQLLVSELEGKITFVLDGGSLELERGGGEALGEAVNAAVRLRGWSGSLNAIARSSLIESFGFADNNASVELSAEDAELRIEELGGELKVEMTGGLLEARRVRGVANIAAHGGATLDLEELASVQLTLVDAEAEVAAMAQLQLKVDRSEIELAGCGSLGLEATSSVVRVAGVERLRQLAAADSRLDLDLREISTPLSMRLTGSTLAVVELPTPCVVRSGSSEALGDSQIRLSGCEMEMRSSSRGRFGRPRPKRLDGSPAIVLNVSLGPEVSLEVNGS